MVRRLLVMLLCWSALAAASPADDWQRYRQRYIDGGRVLDTGNRSVSHSEGQGWGMLLAEANDDRATFDRLWRWTRDNLQRDDVALFAWRYDPGAAPPVQDRNNASDGDLLIAWALLRAGERWQAAEYTRASAAIRKAIRRHLIRQYAGRTLLLPGLHGFEHNDRLVVNLSYLVAPAILAFAEREPDAGWHLLLLDGERLIEEARFGEFQLPPDWLAVAKDGTLAPAAGWPARFSFDAVRVPLYLAWSETPNRDLLQPFRQFWNCCSTVYAWVDLDSGERSPYPASPGVQSIAALLDDRPAATATVDEDYYSASLRLLAGLARRQLAASVRP